MISANVILTEESLDETVRYFLGKDFVFDVETTGEHRGVPQRNKILWIALATYGRTVVIPMGHPNGNTLLAPPIRKKNQVTKKFDITPARWDAPPNQLRPSQVFKGLQPLFFGDSVKVAHNATFDLLSVAKYFGGEVPPPPYADTIVMAWLVNENRRLGLKDLTKAEYRRKYDADNTGRQVEKHPFNKVARYAYLDAAYTWLHYQNLLVDLDRQEVSSVFYDVEMPLLKVLLDMGVQGTEVDVEEMRRLEGVLAKRVVEIEGRVYKAAGHRFNLNSNPQKIAALYGPKSEGGQGLKPWRLTKGGMEKQKNGLEVTLTDYSTDRESLERYPNNRLVKELLDYQEVARVLGTYIRGYLGVDGDLANSTQIFGGKVFPDFVQYGTVTGRFSCRQPNLQNIPRPDTELGKAVRGMFVAPEGYKLIVADYGQIELVVLAHYLGKGALYDGFYQGVDPHTVTASLVFDTAIEEVTKDQRQIAKNINFAVVYGAGPEKVAAMSKTSVVKAKGFLTKHQYEFPEVYRLKDRIVAACRDRKQPHIKTLMGRKRRLPTIWASDWGVRGKAERQAVNSLIQGSSADLIKTAMIRTNDLLQMEDTGRMLLTVHDELVVQTPEEKSGRCVDLVREGMTGEGIQKWLKVPLSIDLKVVTKWSEAK